MSTQVPSPFSPVLYSWPALPRGRRYTGVIAHRSVLVCIHDDVTDGICLTDGGSLGHHSWYSKELP